MNYRLAEILATEALNAAGTKTIDINVSDPISRITVYFYITRTKHGMNAHPAQDITKIELVDGSDVLHSTNGYENQALCIYDRKCEAMVEGFHYAGNEDVSLYGIDFGRHLYDPVLAFEPKRFKNPQLKVTYTLTGQDSGASAGGIAVFANCFDEKLISPMGFLTAKELYSYTCGANLSYEYIDLPTDYIIRKMLVRAYGDGYQPHRQILNVRLDEDNLKRIPIDIDTEVYDRLMRNVWHPVHEHLAGGAVTTGQTIYVTSTDEESGFSGNFMDAYALYVGSWGGGGKLTVTSVTSDSAFVGHVVGHMPNHCWEFPFGDEKDTEDWYDVTKLGSVRLRLQAGATAGSGTGQVVLQQLRRY